MYGFYTYIDVKKGNEVISFLDSLSDSILEITIALNLEDEIFFLCCTNNKLKIDEISIVFPFINVFNLNDEIYNKCYELYLIDMLIANLKKEEWFDIYSQIINEVKCYETLNHKEMVEILTTKTNYYFDNFNNLIDNIDETLFIDIEKDYYLRSYIIGTIVNSIVFLLKNNIGIEKNVLHSFCKQKCHSFIDFMQNQSILIMKN